MYRGDGDNDYYNFFSVERNSTINEINAAYRRLSRIYHPDRHTENWKKEQANIMFNKIKKIHEILSDPQKRALYDTLGENAFNNDGWQLVESIKTSNDIKKEFERMNRIEQEKNYLLSTNPKGQISVVLDATNFFDTIQNNYDKEFPDNNTHQLFDHILNTYTALSDIDIMSMNIFQSVESQLSSTETLVLSGSVNAKNGTGGGDLTTTYRKIHSADKWSEVGLSIGDGLLISCRHFRALTQRMFFNGGINTRLTGEGIMYPAVNIALSRQLDTHLTGQLNWRFGLDSGLSTSLIRQTMNNRLVATFQLGIPHSFLSLSCSSKIFDSKYKLKFQLRLGTSGFLVEYGCEHIFINQPSFLSFQEKKGDKMEQNDNNDDDQENQFTKQFYSTQTTVGAYLSCGVPFGVNLVLKFNRANQNFSCILVLCQDLLPQPIVIGTILPLVVYGLVQKCIVEPYIQKQEASHITNEWKKFNENLIEKRNEALNMTELMKESCEKLIVGEQQKLGLIIHHAFYGVSSDIVDYQNASIFHTNQNNSIPNGFIKSSNTLLTQMIDVTIAVQCLVQSSRLTIPPGSKVNIPGFYDMQYGKDKYLYINYEYRTVPHECLYHDSDAIKLPNAAHKIKIPDT